MAEYEPRAFELGDASGGKTLAISRFAAHAYERPQLLPKTTRRATPQIGRLKVRAFQSTAS